METRNKINTYSSILEALKYIDEAGTSFSTIFVVDEQNKVQGSLTDGDIRRGLLKGISINDKVSVIMQKAFRFIKHKDLVDYTGHLEDFRSKNIRFVPVLDEQGKISEILDLDVIFDVLPLDAFILAGGKGERLLPVTRTIPKPLIQVGEKPILGHNISRLMSYGIKNIFISVNYLSDKIEEYFGNGSSYNVNIKYAKESKPLGTIGSISLIADQLGDEILVMNSDLLTNIDFSDFYRSFKSSGADMAVVVKPFYQDIPYAVIETDDKNFITKIQEKPTFTYYTNAGIYIIKKHLLSFIKGGEVLDATDFIERVINSKIKVYNYPIVKYWLDIGSPEELKRAREDIKHIKL